MNPRFLIILIVSVPFSANCQILEWFHLNTPEDFINSTYYHSPLALCEEGFWTASITGNQDIYDQNEYGSLIIQKYSLDGELLEDEMIEGNAHIEKLRAVGNDLYLHLLFRDSVKLGTTWVYADEFSNGHLLVKRNSQGSYQFTGLPVIEVSTSEITESGTLLFTEQNGFGSTIELREINVQGDALMSRILPHIGYTHNISEKANGDGFLIMGSCNDSTLIDGFEMNPPDFYSNYILSFDEEWNLEWFKIIEDISCVKAHGWSDGVNTRWYGSTAITPAFENEPYAGPNEIGIDFFLVGLTDGNYNWVKETPGTSGWYGVLPSNYQALGVDENLNTYVIGYNRGNAITWENGDVTENQGTRDIYLASYSAEGNLRWARTFGSSNFDMGISILVTGVDEFIITALLNGPAVVGEQVIDAGLGSRLLAKFNSEILATEYSAISKSLEVYPNPSSGELFVSGIQTEDIQHIELLSTTGKILKEWNGNISLPLEISNLPQGLYLLSIQDQKGISTHRIVRQ